MILIVLLSLWFLVGLLEVADFIRVLLRPEFWQALSPSARQMFVHHSLTVVPVLVALLFLAGPVFLLLDVSRWLTRKFSTTA